MTSFVAHLARHTDTSDVSSCWLWGGATDRDGYGRYGKGMAHRAAYESANGPIGVGLQIDHLCRTRRCVNPAHLEAVTPRVNTLRSESIQAQNARKTHCDNGHPFSLENTRVEKGVRRCRPCQRDRSAAYKARKRAAA